jgi:methionyl-tRNA synthetase
LKWGIRVPLEWIAEKSQKSEAKLPADKTEAEGVSNDKVFYVWFDAPNAYISITQDLYERDGNSDGWKRWWLPDDSNDVVYVEFMAKDNVPFHTVFWPSVLIGSRMPFKMVDDIKGFHWLTYDRGKFSTSLKRGVFTDSAIDLFPSDYWRYYLLANCPESADSDFTFEAFASVVNKDLVGILGNFANRLLALIKIHFDLAVPLELTDSTLDKQLIGKITKALGSISSAMECRKFRAAMSALRALWVLGNEYITEKEPWHVLKNDAAAGAITIVHCLHLLRIFAIACVPFMPDTAKRLCAILNEDFSDYECTPIASCSTFLHFAKGHVINANEQLLFEKIDAKDVIRLSELYSGRRA